MHLQGDRNLSPVFLSLRNAIRMFSFSFFRSCSRSLWLSFWKPSTDLSSLSVRPYIRPSVRPTHQPTLRPSLSLIRRKRNIHHGWLYVPTFLGRQSWAFQNCDYQRSTSSLVVLSHVYFLMYTLLLGISLDVEFI